MALDVGTPLKLDVGPALQAIDRLTAADSTFRAEQQKTSASVTTSYSEMARQALAYSENLKRQQDEVRAGAAATRSAIEEVRRLTAANKELELAKKKATSADEVARLTKELEKNRLEIEKAKQAIDENRAATDQARLSVEQAREAQRQNTAEAKASAAAQRDAALASRQSAAAQREAALQAKAQATAEKQASSEIDKEVRSAGLLVQLTKQLADLTERRARATTKEEAQGYTKQIADTKGQINELTEELNEAGKSGGVLSGILGKLGGAAVAAFTVDKILEVGREIEAVTAKFEKYRITLTGAFDGNQGRADRALIQVRNFADANGIEIESLTDTYVKLVNRGIIPTTNQLRQLSDIAATSGKSTDQFVEALLDAQTGEFERLKEFGIKVKNNGDTLTLSFRGVKQEIQNTQGAITDYLYALGDAQGVQGQAAAQLKSLGGASIDAKNGITELLQVIGERSKSVFSGLSSAVGGAARALANYFKSSDQIALEQSASGIDRYSALVAAKFNQIAADTKAKGGDVSATLQQAADDQTKFIDAKLAKARKNLADYEKAAQEASIAGGGEVDARDPNEIARLQTAIKLYEGQREAATRAYKVSVEGANAELDAIGRIEALRKKIAAEEKARDAAPDTNAGNKERVRLVQQLVADNKLLNELLGKQDKASQAAADKLGAALRALYAERATLQGLAAKASIKDSEDQAERARLAFDESLRQIAQTEQKLKEREAAVRKAGGSGANADGVIDGTQEKALGQLRVAALDKYYADLFAITRAREQRLFDLRADSDAKEIEAVDRKYDALIKTNTDGIERQAIEEARQREQLALKAAQEQRRIDQTARLAQNTATAVGQTFGEGTGISVIEAKRAEQQALLDIEKKAAEDSLNNTLNRTGKEAAIERAALRAQLARIQQQQLALNREKAAIPAEDLFFKAIFGDEDSDANREKLGQIVGQFKDAQLQMTQAAIQAADAKISSYDRSISELSNSLAAEIQLNQEGSASNIKGIQDQIAEEKQARRAAIDEKKRAQKEEAIINGLQQASALATAAANLILGWSELPIVGQVLGALSVAAMLASFLAAKSTANSAAQSSFFKGGYTGDGDEHEVSTAQGKRGYEYHKREFIMRHELTDQYRHDLFEPLHLGRPDKIDWSGEHMKALLPDLELPDKLKQEKAEALRIQHEHTFAPMKQDFDRLHTRLEAIEATNLRMADQPARVPLGNGRIVEIAENGSTHIKNLG